ncbi:TPA: hypothetical protein QFG09_001488 [Enterococcus faecium]
MREPVIPGGAIFVARKLNSSAIFQKPPLYLKVWMFLLTQAQHKDYKGLKRGQLFTSIPQIQKAVSWKVGYRTETPTKKQIFGILDWLRFPSEGNDEGNAMEPMIVTTKVTHGLLITICNYNVYQSLSNYEGNDGSNSDSHTKGLRPESEGNNINKNVYKNDKNDNKPSNQDLMDRFDLIWKKYPNKKGKAAAFKAYCKALKEGVTDETILDGINRYKKEIAIKNTDKQYIAHGSTWFSQNRWEDDYEIESAAKNEPSDADDILRTQKIFDELR